METARWYYDLISPFAYLHFHSLAPLRERMRIEPVPVLLAGMLKHWGTKGPAETAPKRLHTYQYCVWQAGVQGQLLGEPLRDEARGEGVVPALVVQAAHGEEGIGGAHAQ